MSKTYEDLSRKGLIKLGHDFDRDNDGALQHYLAEHGDNYQNIRPVESVIERVDQIVETVSAPIRRVKKSAEENDCKKTVVAVLDAVADNADVIKSGIGVVTALMK